MHTLATSSLSSIHGFMFIEMLIEECHFVYMLCICNTTLNVVVKIRIKLPPKFLSPAVFLFTPFSFTYSTIQPSIMAS